MSSIRNIEASDFLLEKKLNRERPDLHRNMSDNVVILQTMLTKFLTRFPDYTDHSLLHSLNVLDFLGNGRPVVGLIEHVAGKTGKG